MIGGAVTNGATSSSVDWASFLLGHLAAVRPPEEGGVESITGQANVSYKAAALTRYPEDALYEGRFRQQLARDGVAVRNDPRIVVAHVQPLRAIEACVLHFHDGRCVAASRRGTVVQRANALAWPFAVPIATLRILRRTRRLGGPWFAHAVRALPWLVAMIAAHKAGEHVGTLRGAGRSPWRMR